jgi:release factor glutamine methyltransferase
MMSENPLGRLRKYFTFQELIILCGGSVHTPDEYGALLAASLDPRAGTRALDLTSGAGLHALVLAAAGCRVLACDLSADAIEATRKNSILNSLESAIEVLQSDLYENIHPRERFDVIVALPPTMPTPDRLARADWWGRANNGGFDGREVFDRVINGSPDRLTESGELWVLHPWYLSMNMTVDLAHRIGLKVDLVATETFQMGSLSFERLPYIRSLGVTPVVKNGELLQVMSVLRLRLRRPD